ncbi:MAG: D-glycero-beta-D-manno-heptose-7-phosphate kinase [Thermodesulfovibrionia bacterium]|nr:D-glycero-beta-D-manno-heptose-7-phosphate kinase [Thermodesulfovibrionia bacterium]
MKSLFKKFKDTGILIIGDLMVDQYIWGTVKRISPEAPVPVVEVSNENLTLGGAANVARNITSLGGKVFIAGVIGDDDTGKILTRELNKNGINTDGILIDKDRPTTVKTRIIAHNQQVVRFDRESKSGISSSLTSSILEYVKECLPHIKGIIISDYCKGVITKHLIQEIISITRSKVFISADPKVGHFNYYKGVSIITPNLNEASFGSGVDIKDEETLLEAGNVLMKKLQSDAVLITKGDQGMTLFEKNGNVTHIPTFAQEVFDVTGAGDTVIATLTLCRAAGLKLKESAIYANHAAGAVVGEVGTTVATPEDIIKSMKTGDKR